MLNDQWDYYYQVFDYEIVFYLNWLKEYLLCLPERLVCGLNQSLERLLFRIASSDLLRSLHLVEFLHWDALCLLWLLIRLIAFYLLFNPLSSSFLSLILSPFLLFLSLLSASLLFLSLLFLLILSLLFPFLPFPSILFLPFILIPFLPFPSIPYVPFPFIPSHSFHWE